jgi:hypothetical protein
VVGSEQNGGDGKNENRKNEFESEMLCRYSCDVISEKPERDEREGYNNFVEQKDCPPGHVVAHYLPKIALAIGDEAKYVLHKVFRGV